MASSISSWLLASASALCVGAPAAAADLHHIHQDHVLGTSLDATVFGGDAAVAARAFAAMTAEIDRLDLILSGWRSDSELAALNASAGPFTASDDLYRVVAACERWRAACPGDFSGRLGRVEALWREAAATGALPHPDALHEAAEAAEAAEVGLDPTTRAIHRPQAVVFAMDALAKGYILDRALEAARDAAPEALGLMLDIGGDLKVWGQAPDGVWRTGVAKGRDADNLAPTHVIGLNDKAVATSGAGARDRTVSGRPHGHLLSPRTGQAVETPTAAVVADTAMDADALATAVALAGHERGLALAAGFGAEARLISDDDDARQTSGWSDLVYRPALTPWRIPVATAPSEWPANFGVRIDVTLLKPEFFPYRAPYVAIWVSDAQGRIVRLLGQWGREDRYMAENFVWWRAFQPTNAWQRLAAVTRPTRAPGTYAITWDGRNDAGQPLPQGAYTIHVESKREGGPHTHKAITINAGVAPASGSTPPEAELGTVAVRYGRMP